MGYTVIKDGKRHCIMCKEARAVVEFPQYSYTTNQGKPSKRYGSRCSDCERTRRLCRYERRGHIERSIAREYKTANREKIAAKEREFALENRELVLCRRRAYEAKRRAVCGNNPRRSANGEVYLRVLDEARIGNLWLDAYDGELIDNPTVDHIVPVAKGGCHEYENLCVTSKANNSSKHTRSLLQWLAER
jgi:hypothetical protein